MARRPGNRVPPNRVERRSAGLRPASTAGGGRNHVPPFALTGRRQGNADLRSAQRPAGPRRRGPQPSEWLLSRRVPRRTGWRAGPGTAYPRTAWSAAGAPVSDRHRPPEAVETAYRRLLSRDAGKGTPTSGRHSGPQGRGGANPNRRDGSFLGAYPGGQGGAQAREPRTPNREKARGRPGAPVFTPASRGSAKPAPMALRHPLSEFRLRPSRMARPPSLPSPRRRGRRKRHPRVAPGGAGPVTSRAGTRGRRATSSSRRPARPI